MVITKENCDFSGYVTRPNIRCSDGLTIDKNAFAHADGMQLPLVWNHQHNDIHNVIGEVLIEHREDGEYGYGKFNETESGLIGKELVANGTIKHMSIFATHLKKAKNYVAHGDLKEVSLVYSGANPGAFIDSVMCHSDDGDDNGVIYTDEDITLCHSEDDDDIDYDFEEVSHAEDIEEKKEDQKMSEPEKKTEEVKQENPEKVETVGDVFETLSEKQKKAVYVILGKMLEDAKASGDKNEEIKHSEMEEIDMYQNIFEPKSVEDTTVLTHADQTAIIERAKQPGMTLKSAMKAYINDNKDTLAHAFEATGDNGIDKLFPDFKEVHPGAPELIERDHEWVAQVMNTARKSPISRVRTTQVDARDKALRAKGYNDRSSEKEISGNVKLLRRTTEPQTVYYRDQIHRDDVIDVTDFDVVAYQNRIAQNGLKEEIALAALVGDGRSDSDPDKISEEHIRPVWGDAPLYTIQALVDLDAAETELQGTNTAANFGESFIYTEAVIKAVMDARVQYRGKGMPDYYCDPISLNKMLLARDLNGRRLYETADDLAKVLNVRKIVTVEQFADLKAREGEDSKKFKLLGLMVNMANYQFGCAKGGEITSFDDFDMDFNTYKTLVETRVSGALTEIYSAIAVEMEEAEG